MPAAEQETQRRGFSGSQVAAIVAITILLTAGLSLWLFRTYISPPEFTPVALSASETATLNTKLRTLGIAPAEPPAASPMQDAVDAQGRLEPSKYEEKPGNRHVRMTEREVNAIIAKDTALAKRFAIDLSRDLASAKLLIPVDPDFPIMGGKTLRVTAGLELAYTDERPIVKLRGVSIMGAPMPNAWLGNLKNIDLVEQFGSDPGFWSAFAQGINQIKVDEGQLYIELKE